jgi:hypothetical protein
MENIKMILRINVKFDSKDTQINKAQDRGFNHIGEKKKGTTSRRSLSN